MLTALVTGASRGIGEGVALMLAQRGIRVLVHGRSPSTTLRTLHERLENPELNHQMLCADLMTEQGAIELWESALKVSPSIDILINNAGVYVMHPLDGITQTDWDKAFSETLQTNLMAPAQLMQRAARHMQGHELKQPFGRGRIVNISSRGAFRGEPDAPGYAAAKAGLNALGQSMAKALAPRAIYTFTIAPGWVATDMALPHLQGPQAAEITAQHPLGRVATVDELGSLTVYCALDAPPPMTGSIIDINGASYLRS